ncbi:acyl-CoA synthetase (AMP-forming)/AMP-acid ligase II [Leucobacter exalbidus]|uniref:Acyl-CoA synthetase (AMP-forming)/AMP-acid ligase II n=1 Tax=Leucobacter exalbidus TaxID=662960 RepID=A0A940T5H2_9MICO|nr:AMP-binding protein [Leucobacter exalbidus]MBP1325996.1 acyl-CoA synthetase (AMP-forming)/AMP-acid ligase II [Leucobacter exalbidus]
MSELATAQTIPALLAERSTLGDHPAVIDQGHTISYRELFEQVEAVAKSYWAGGVRRGDRVAVWAPNRTECILAFLGAQYLGAAVVPLNTRYTGREAAEILARSGASVLVLTDEFLGLGLSRKLREATEQADAPALTALTTIVTMDDVAAEGCRTWADFLADGADVPGDVLAAAAAAVSPDDIVDILFTSGTTGQPKGVMSAQRQTIGVAHAWALGADLAATDRYCIVNPIFHGFGYKAGLIASLIAGATMYPIPVFNTDDVLTLIERERITVLPGVPTIFTSLIDHPNLADFDLSSLRFAIAGATAAPDSLFHDMVNILGFSRVAQAYGLTECVVATMSRPGEDLAHASQTTGPAVANIEIRIAGAEGEILPVGGEGEILLRGDNVMLGYFEDPEATSAAFDADGWFHTGDVGCLDEHGCLKITDRIKDMFIVGGFNVYPAEVENTLRRHPAVNESAVIGIEDARMGSVGRAYVALLREADPKPTAEDITAFCRTRLAGFKVPKEIVFVDDFPRNATGKILKSDLRAAV